MPRRARKDSLEGKYFHVMVQGIGKERVFPDDNSKGYFLSSLKKAKEKTAVFIFAFCVMDNHAHILLQADLMEELSKFMHFANAEYARYYNSVNTRVGYVFRNRFKSEIISDVKYLINCLAYIHNNPVKANIVRNAEDYKYSSYGNYLQKTGIVDFVKAAECYDTSSENIKSIMHEKSYSEWLEHDEVKYEIFGDVFKDLSKKYNFSNKMLLVDDELLRNVVVELQNRTGLSIRKISKLLEVNRERIRIVLSRERVR